MLKGGPFQSVSGENLGAYNPNNPRVHGTATSRMCAYLKADGDDVFVPGFIADGAVCGLNQYDVVVVQTPLMQTTGIHSLLALDKVAGWASIGW